MAGRLSAASLIDGVFHLDWRGLVLVVDHGKELSQPLHTLRIQVGFLPEMDPWGRTGRRCGRCTSSITPPAAADLFHKRAKPVWTATFDDDTPVEGVAAFLTWLSDPAGITRTRYEAEGVRRLAREAVGRRHLTPQHVACRRSLGPATRHARADRRRGDRPAKADRVRAPSGVQCLFRAWRRACWAVCNRCSRSAASWLLAIRVSISSG